MASSMHADYRQTISMAYMTRNIDRLLDVAHGVVVHAKPNFSESRVKIVGELLQVVSLHFDDMSVE